MSDNKNSERNNTAGGVKIDCYEKNCSTETLNLFNNYSEDDIKLYNNFIHTTNSLVYDGSYSVCSSPDSVPDVSFNSYMSLSNISGSSSKSLLAERQLETKKEEVNLSGEDCNIMEEFAQCSTHLSLYELEQKNHLNSLVQSNNSNRYDDYLPLNSDEQTDIETCDRESEPEFVNVESNEMFSKPEGGNESMYFEEMDNILDPKSAHIHLIQKQVPNTTSSTDCNDPPADYLKIDTATEYHSTNDFTSSYDISSEDVSSYGSLSKMSTSQGQSSGTLSRYEIMKRRKIAKSERKSSKELTITQAQEPVKDDMQESIDDLVSFIEGKHILQCSSVKSATEDTESSLKNNLSSSHHLGLGRSMKRNMKRKKKKEKAPAKIEASNVSTTSESTFVTLSESLPDSKSSCELVNDVSMAADICFPSSQVSQDAVSKDSHIILESKSNEKMPNRCDINDPAAEKIEDLKNSSIDGAHNHLSIEFEKQPSPENAKLEDTSSSNNKIFSAKTRSKKRFGVASLIHCFNLNNDSDNISNDLISCWSAGTSTYDAVDNFPELPLHLLNSAGKEMSLDFENVSNSNINNYNNNDVPGAVDKKYKMENGRSIESQRKFAEADEDKFTEFSYSTNTNSSVQSCDELSSKESEAEDFVMVQKKKKVRLHDRLPVRQLPNGRMSHKGFSNDKEKHENFTKSRRMLADEAGGFTVPAQSLYGQNVTSYGFHNKIGDMNVPAGQIVQNGKDVGCNSTSNGHQNLKSTEPSSNFSSLDKSKEIEGNIPLCSMSNVSVANRFDETDPVSENVPVCSTERSLEVTTNLDSLLYSNLSSSSEHQSLASKIISSVDPPTDIKCQVDDIVFFDTRYLNKCDNLKSSASSDISFMFDDQIKSTEKDSEGNGPSSSLSTSRFEADLKLSKPDENINFNTSNSSNLELADPISTSANGSNVEVLQSHVEDKNSQCLRTDVPECNNNFQSNVLILPKQVYGCSEDMILSMPYLPYASTSLYNSFPVGFAASVPECQPYAVGADGNQSQEMLAGSEQVLTNSSFHLQHSLPLLSPVFAPYNCYLTVIPSSNHDSQYLTSHHPQLNYGDAAGEIEDGRILMMHNYSSFPYLRRLDVSDEQLHIIQNGDAGESSNYVSGAVDSSSQFSVNSLAAHDPISFTNFKCVEADHQPDDADKDLESSQNEKGAVDENFEEGETVVHFAKNTPSNIERTAESNGELENSENRRSCHSSDDQSNKEDKDLLNHRPNREFTCQCKNERNADVSCCCSIEGKKLTTSLKQPVFNRRRSSFNLESAQLYLLSLYKAMEGNCIVYCED